MKNLKPALYFIAASTVICLLSIVFNQITLKKKEDCALEAQPTDWLFNQRAFPYEQIHRESYWGAIRQAQSFRKQAIFTRNATNWTLAGPFNAGGRITSIAAHPADAQTIYIGAAAGGVFKTDNGGSTWAPIFDNNSSLSIGDIAIAPSNKDVLYVGTGEANGGGGSVNFDGLGVFKSRNGGSSWQNIGLENVGSIGKVAIDPQNPNTVFVAGMGYLYENSPHRGVYRTKDGGSTWQKVLYLSDSTGCIDISINPNNPNIIYAAMWERIRRPHLRDYGGSTCGIYRSKNGGDTWEKLSNGLPTTDVGRIGIVVSPAAPEGGTAGSVCYAIYADEVGFFKGIYQSTDAGDNWVKQDPNNQLTYMYASFGWWFGKIYADPTDAHKAYVLGLTVHRTHDDGQNWQPIAANVHVDQHALWINPNNPNQIYCGNDGGFYTSDNGGASWNYVNNLPISQFYTCEIDAKNPERLYGGTQDNGTWRTLTGGTSDWQQILSADGFVSLVNPMDNNYVYASAQNGAFYRSTNGGQTFSGALSGMGLTDRRNWKTPVVMAPDNPATLYYGSNRLYRSTNHANTWTAISPDLTKGSGGGNLVYGTLTAIAVSPKNPQIIYCGTDDGTVSVTSDGGFNWSKITNGLPNRWVTAIEADPFDENTAYITFSGYKWWDYQPHVLKTKNKGNTWQDISGNLPEAPVNDIIADPSPTAQNAGSGSQVYYVATDFGVFTTYNGGVKWEIVGTGLPLVSVMDMTFHAATRTLVAATHGRSMYRINLPTVNNNLSIGGSIRREQGDTVGAQIALFQNSLLQTYNSSFFNFSQLTNGQNYRVIPYRNDNPVRGVTTFDIALISRHILGIAALNTPYKIIAGDVNHDGELDAEDMLIIRKLILRQLDTFPRNTSWRFVPKKYVFSNPENPFSTTFPEYWTVNNLTENISNADFYAVKTGDVNNSATLLWNDTPEIRNKDKILTINILDQLLEAGKTYKIPLVINAGEEKNVECATLSGMQFALNWDKNTVENFDIQAGDLPQFAASDWAVFPKKGIAAVAWNGQNFIKNNQPITLVNLMIQPKKATQLSKILSPNLHHTEGGAFDATGQQFSVKWHFIAPQKKALTVFQNYPNPFTYDTKIPFYLTESTDVRLTVSDLSGRVLMQVYRPNAKGYSEMGFIPSDLNLSGVLIYRLETAQQTETRVMLLKR